VFSEGNFWVQNEFRLCTRCTVNLRLNFECVRDAHVVKTRVSGLKSVRQLESTVIAEAVWSWLSVGVRLAATLLFADVWSILPTLSAGGQTLNWPEPVRWRFRSAVELKTVRWRSCQPLGWSYSLEISVSRWAADRPLGVCLPENEAGSSGCWTTYLSLSRGYISFIILLTRGVERTSNLLNHWA